MSFLTFIINLFNNNSTQSSVWTTNNILNDKSIYNLFPGTIKIIMDSKYKLIPKNNMNYFLKNDNTSYKKYVAEFHDCDDFAVVLWGRLKENFQGGAIGLALSDEHAFNFFIDDKCQVWIIEPQNDKIFKPNNTSKYKLKRIFL